MRTLFKNLKQEQLHTTSSFAHGEVLPVTQVPIKEFSQKKWEDGYGLLLNLDEDTIYSPVNGEITAISANGNAYRIMSEEGLDIYIHLGVDTEDLDETYFPTTCSVGKKVSMGEAIGGIQLKRLYAAHKCPVSYLLFLSGEEVRLREHHSMVGPDYTDFFWCARTEKLI